MFVITPIGIHIVNERRYYYSRKCIGARLHALVHFVIPGSGENNIKKKKKKKKRGFA